MSGPIQERNQDATVYVGDMDPQVNEALLWELFLQSGHVVNVHIPKDKLTQQHMGYGFVEFHSEDDADYAMKIMNMIKLFGKPLKVNKVYDPFLYYLIIYSPYIYIHHPPHYLFYGISTIIMFYMLYYDENHYLLLLIYSYPSLSLLLASMLIIMQASRDKKTLDVGANLFIGNLDPDVDEKLLYDTFGAFGVIISTPKVYPSLSLLPHILILASFSKSFPSYSLDEAVKLE